MDQIKRGIYGLIQRIDNANPDEKLLESKQ